jgi:hypothetical protein
MMNKLLTLIATTFIALTAILGSGAEAGFNLRIKAPTDFSSLHMAGGCGGGGGYFRSSRKSSYRSVSRRVKRDVDVAQQPAKSVTVAKTEPEALPETTDKTAEVENSSISTADGQVAEVKTAEPEQKIAVAKDVGCKKFFASAGMTLSVPCE